MPNEQGQKYTTSFIPKKPVYAPKTGKIKSGKGPNFLSLLGLVFFLGSILMAGGVFVWKLQTQATIDSQISDLKKAQAEFDEKTIAAATRLNERIIAVKDLLDNHKAPSEVFSVLENITLETVRFRKLSYVTEEDGSISMMGTGQAIGFESVVLQSDEFGGTGSFRDVIFSEVQSNVEGGIVTFSLDSVLDPDLVLYRKKFSATFGTGDPEIFDEQADSASSRNIFNN